MNLQNNEVSIRLFTEADISNKVAWINDPQNNQYLHYNIPLNYEDTRAWFLNKNNDVRVDCVIEFHGVAVGLCGLLNIDKRNQKAEFYISMGDNSVKRKGIATQATLLLLRYAFDELGLNKVYLNVDEGNLAACCLYEKVGFVCEGTFMRDLYHRGKLINRKRYAIFCETVLSDERFSRNEEKR